MERIALAIVHAIKKAISWALSSILILLGCQATAFAAPRSAKITFIDSGAGDCILIDCPNNSGAREQILVDCGTRGKYVKVDRSGQLVSEPASSFASTIIENLDGGKGYALEAALITHGDSDHYNILNAWLQSAEKKYYKSDIKIKNLVMGGLKADYTQLRPADTPDYKGNLPFLNYVETVANQSGGRVEQIKWVMVDNEAEWTPSKLLKCPQSRTWVQEKKNYSETISFTALSTPGVFSNARLNKNIRSAVYVMTHALTVQDPKGDPKTPVPPIFSHVILTGDALNETVAEILKRAAGAKKAQFEGLIHDEHIVIMKARHHGSHRQIFTQGNNPSDVWLRKFGTDALVLTGGGVDLHPHCEKINHAAAYFRTKTAPVASQFTLKGTINAAHCFFHEDKKRDGKSTTLEGVPNMVTSDSNFGGAIFSTYSGKPKQVNFLSYEFTKKTWEKKQVKLGADFLAGKGLMRTPGCNDFPEPLPSIYPGSMRSTSEGVFYELDTKGKAKIVEGGPAIAPPPKSIESSGARPPAPERPSQTKPEKMVVEKTGAATPATPIAKPPRHPDTSRGKKRVFEKCEGSVEDKKKEEKPTKRQSFDGSIERVSGKSK